MQPLSFLKGIPRLSVWLVEPAFFFQGVPPHERLHLLKLSLVRGICIIESQSLKALEASPDGRPLTEKQRCSGSYRRAVSFQVFKDDSISQRPSLRRLRSRSTVHARRNLPVKEFCYLRTVNLTAAMCRQVNGKVQDSTWQVRKWGRRASPPTYPPHD